MKLNLLMFKMLVRLSIVVANIAIKHKDTSIQMQGEAIEIQNILLDVERQLREQGEYD